MRKLALTCAPAILAVALAGCSATSAPTAAEPPAHKAEKAEKPAEKPGENAAGVRDTVGLVRLMRLTTHYDYEPYATPRTMLNGVDIALTGEVVSVDPAIIADELDGQGAVIVGLRPAEIWKDDAGRTGDVVYFHVKRPKNVGVGAYRNGLPAGTEVSLFGFVAERTRFTQGAKPGVTYTAAPQGLMISDSKAGLVNVWGAEEAAGAWRDLRTVRDLKAAIGE